ncbi:uncharacterized protein BKA55DRAFT_683145 [Fusarium redolens]|uniref:Uncharacterized protein n=1 Tax=Fusarium redolens TaxID=48865 RepID=A0A9P9KX60_FUSRE|nr:uncharacterized protein BKA55DRAFT_683145 [Fusarium redolens]KAH7270071.1 hypothetical protein BKA55DRAFT_683145 [Fusarium redolens]
MSFQDTHIEAGTLVFTLPLSKSGTRQQKPKRCAGQPIYFGLTLNYESGPILWPWKGFLCSGVPLDAVCLLDGMTEVTVRADAVWNYDDNERRRITNFNKEYVKENACRAIKKWSREGSHPQPTIDAEDSALHIAQLKLGASCVRPEAERMAKVADEVENKPPGRSPVFP